MFVYLIPSSDGSISTINSVYILIEDGEAIRIWDIWPDPGRVMIS